MNYHSNITHWSRIAIVLDGVNLSSLSDLYRQRQRANSTNGWRCAWHDTRYEPPYVPVRMEQFSCVFLSPFDTIGHPAFVRCQLVVTLHAMHRPIQLAVANNTVSLHRDVANNDAFNMRIHRAAALWWLKLIALTVRTFSWSVFPPQERSLILSKQK